MNRLLSTPALRGLALTAGSLVAACALAACGTSTTTDTAAAPSNPDKPATGTLKIFSYEDSVTPELMDPFKQQNPDLKIESATFDSDSEAAAKMSGGFQADVVEICLDESKPLTARNLVRPVETSGVKDWGQLAFHDNKELKFDGGALFVPLSAGPEGLIYNTEEVPDGIKSYADLYDPRFKGRAALEGDYELPPIAITALSLGIEDPMNMSEDELKKVGDYMNGHRDQFRALWRSDSDLVSLFKTGEVVVADGNTAQAKRMQEAGIPVKWVAPSEGTLSWVCGFGIGSGAQNTDAAYRLINWQASARAQAIRGRNGYVVTNPAALKLLTPAEAKTADPSSLKTAIPETYPPISDQWVRTFETFQAG